VLRREEVNEVELAHDGRSSFGAPELRLFSKSASVLGRVGGSCGAQNERAAGYTHTTATVGPF
jgi:hypothetical protein